MSSAAPEPSRSALDVVFFDVVETLFSLDAVGRRLAEAGAGDGALELWFARFLRDGFALAASGGYHPFRDVAESSLASVLRSRGVDPQPSTLDRILAGFGELDAHADTRAGLELARSRGAKVITLPNGSAQMTGRLLERAGLDSLVDARLSVEETRAWKPRPEPYLAACRAAGVVPERAALVAVHGWDVHGAAVVGLRTGWCSRLEGEFASVFTPPTVRGATLPDVVDQLVPTG